ncbi:MAG TPA: hypothetical protein VF701_19140, partial [Thermoanaerobaculia bacterium]
MAKSDPSIARRNLTRARTFIEAGRLDAAEKALTRALEFTESERLYADIHTLHAQIATTRGNAQEALESWYQVAAALRAILDCSDPDCRCGDDTAEVLSEFVVCRLAIASIHAARIECFRAATIVDEAIGRLWPHEDDERFRRLLEECLIIRTSELLHCHRLHEALGLANELRVRALEMPLALRARAFEVIGRAEKDHQECADAADAFEAAAEAYAALVKEESDVRERLLIVALEHGVERAHTGDHARAAEVLDDALRAASGFEGEDPNWSEYLLQAQIAFGDALEQLERCEEAAEAYRGAVANLKARSEAEPSRLARILG